jgi:hypothetical protein
MGPVRDVRVEESAVLAAGDLYLGGFPNLKVIYL